MASLLKYCWEKYRFESGITRGIKDSERDPKMTATTFALSATILFSMILFGAPVQAQENGWETHYSKAERAYAKRNLFVARHEFMVALKEARSCQKDRELTMKLESLASSYQSQDNLALAQPLLKLAQKLKSNAGTI